MLPQMRPYTPSLYRPNGYGRFRQYPRQVDASIPGTGYRVGNLAWAEQELNLDGSPQPQHYGDYDVVPLRGLGAEQGVTRSFAPAEPPELPPETNWIPWILGIGAAAAVGGGAWYMMRRRKLAANRRRRRRRR